jgi:hypothetical protein
MERRAVQSDAIAKARSAGSSDEQSRKQRVPEQRRNMTQVPLRRHLDFPAIMRAWTQYKER